MSWFGMSSILQLWTTLEALTLGQQPRRSLGRQLTSGDSKCRMKNRLQLR